MNSAVFAVMIFVIITYGLITVCLGSKLEKFLDEGSFGFLIPSVWRRTKIFNWFGAIFMTVLMHIIFLPWAIGFWFWKMLTVGGNK